MMHDWIDEEDDDTDSVASNSIESADVRQLTNPYSDPTEILRKFRSYEIDHVGNGSFQISQLNLLAKRSLEPVRSLDAQLSARGLHHRSLDVFIRDATNATNVIKGMMRGEKARVGHYKPSAQLFQPHFARAVANERLQRIDEAIADYSMCLKINPQTAVCYFNRAGLFRLKKIFARAIEDMHAAVRIEPTNMDFRQYRALICREGGDYEQAMQDTIVCKAVAKRPELKRLIEKSGEAAVAQIVMRQDALTAATSNALATSSSAAFDHSNSISSSNGSVSRAGVALSEDPIVAALEISGHDRTDAQLTLIKDFLKTVKLFAPLASQALVLTQIAQAVQLSTFDKNGVIFSEGDAGHHFYIILDGEVAITKTKILVEASAPSSNANSNAANNFAALLPEEKGLEEAITETVVLVKLFRGQSFGETALESKGGLRTAGAMATQPTRLLSLHVDAYHSILHRFRAALKEEVRALIATNAIFASWEDAKIEHLASLVVIKQFAANAEIMGANKPVPALMLVKSGIVTLLKAVPRRLLRTPSAPTASTSSSKTSQSKNETMKGTTSKKVSSNAVATNSKVIQTSGSSTLFAGETPGLWIVNKGWTTHLDEQIMREHTQYILDQRAKTGNALLSSLEQQQQQQQNHHNNNSNGNNAIHNSSSNHNNSTRPPSSSSTTPAAVSGSVPINATTGLPQLDASELDLAELAVGVLGSGQVFGELAVLDPQQPSPVSALASTAVELFCFESDVLAALGARFYGGTMRTLLESIALHDPPLDKIGFFFRQKFSWEQHKQRLMQRLQQKQKPPRPTKTLIASASTTSLTGPASQSQSQSLSLPPIVKK